MKCNCIADITAELSKKAVNMGASKPAVSLDLLGINLSTGESIISLPFTLRGENRPFNTLKGKPISVVASFCPFCGKPANAQPFAEAP